MNTIRAYIGQELFWENTAIFASKYELVASNEVLATLDMDSLGSNATAEAAEGSVTIESRGFFGATYHILQGETEIAVFTPNWGGSGTLQFSDGRVLYWDSVGFFSGEYVWKDASDNPLLHFRSSFGSSKLYVVIEPPAVNIPELSLLAILGRYLEKLHQRRNAAAGAIPKG